MKKIAFVICSVILLGCSENKTVPVQEQLKIDIMKIDEYLAKNNITALIDDDSGIRYVIDDEGTGNHPNIKNTVVIKYEGRLLSDGSVFDASETKVNKQIEGSLNQFIPGWRIGIPFYKKGGRGTLYIPSGWAYGRTGKGSAIGKDAILIFDIEIIDIK